jgi:hypothetical protein
LSTTRYSSSSRVSDGNDAIAGWCGGGGDGGTAESGDEEDENEANASAGGGDGRTAAPWYISPSFFCIPAEQQNESFVSTIFAKNQNQYENDEVVCMVASAEGESLVCPWEFEHDSN